MIEGLEWLKLALARFRALPSAEGEVNALRQALLAKALFAQGMVSIATGGSINSLDNRWMKPSPSRTHWRPKTYAGILRMEMFYTTTRRL